MENWGWSEGKSADQLADYMGFALKILKNAGLECEGSRRPAASAIVRCRLARRRSRLAATSSTTEIPHYFRHLFTDPERRPAVEYARDSTGRPAVRRLDHRLHGRLVRRLGRPDPGSADQFITADLKGGRLPEVSRAASRPIMVCHWPGMYFNGEEIGFKIFQEVVRRLHAATTTSSG